MGTPMILCVSHFVLFLKAFGQELLDYFLEKNDLWMVKRFPHSLMVIFLSIPCSISLSSILTCRTEYSLLLDSRLNPDGSAPDGMSL